jgi:peptidoglycan DL-endopeptidase CwlO
MCAGRVVRLRVVAKHRRPEPPADGRTALLSVITGGTLTGLALVVTAATSSVNSAPTGLQSAAATEITLPIIPLDIGPLVKPSPALDTTSPVAVTASVVPTAVVEAQPATRHRIALQPADGTARRVVLPPTIAPPAKAQPAAVLSSATRALDAALGMRGVPYVYGGTGRSGVDCSGLVQLAYRAAGITLPRTAAAQAGEGRTVPLSQIQPGDLLFYYAPISHVAIALGNGKVIEASQPGQPVAIHALYTNGLSVIKRIVS